MFVFPRMNVKGRTPTSVRELDSDTLMVLAHAADYMAENSFASDRDGQSSAYLRHAARDARAAAERL